MSNRVLLGKFPSGDNSPNGYGLRISKAGYNVNTPNPDNQSLIFNSDWKDVLPVFATGKLSVAAGGTATFNHNLGYIPFIAGFVNVGNRGWAAYSPCNVLFSHYVWTPTYSYGGNDTRDLCVENPQNVYSYSGDRLTNLQYRATSSQITFYCTEAAQLYYIIYQTKAF